MKQVQARMSTYAADVSGVCSALYELGGMTIMHDASGCNSTYTTHDEPRWYDMDSWVFLSGLTEMDAVMGNDEKLIGDIEHAASELHPKFIAIAGSPIPMMVGFDYVANAAIIEKRTGIPTFGVTTNGMQSYQIGVSDAYLCVLKQLVKKSEEHHNSINILGATPLDFALNGQVEAIKELFENRGIQVESCWSMGSSLEELQHASKASCNLVVSFSGYKSAKYMEEHFGIPYVVGTPYGEQLASKIVDDVLDTMKTKVSKLSYVDMEPKVSYDGIIIGESITACSLRAALALESEKFYKVICPLESEKQLMMSDDMLLVGEDEIFEEFGNAKSIIADPLYKRMYKGKAPFFELPHVGCSGRQYLDQIPNFINRQIGELK